VNVDTHEYSKQREVNLLLAVHSGMLSRSYTVNREKFIYI